MEKNILGLIKLQIKNGYTDTQMGAFLGVHGGTYVRWRKGITSPKSQSHKDGIIKLLKTG